MMNNHRFGGPDVYLNGQSGSPLSILSSSHGPLQQLGGFGVDLSHINFPGHFGNKLSEVQKVLQIVDNTVCRQKRDRNPKEILKLTTYMKELGTQMEEQKLVQSSFHKGDPENHTKIISDSVLEKVSEAKSLISEPKKPVEVKEEKPNPDPRREEKPTDRLSQFLCFSCQYCKETFSGPIPLHQHERYLCNMNEEIKAVLQPADAGPAAAPQQSTDEGASRTMKSLKDVSVLKTCFDINAEPNTEDLHKISMAVGLPEDFISEWFSQWKRQNDQRGHVRTTSPHPDSYGLDTSVAQSPAPLPAVEVHGCLTKKRQLQNHRPALGAKTRDLEVHMRSSTPPPHNLSTPLSSSWSCQVSEDVCGDSPLDLSLPKVQFNGLFGENNEEEAPGPSDLINIKKEVLAPEIRTNLLSQLERSTSPLFGMNHFAGCQVYASLPHEAFPPPTFMSPARATIPSFRPYAALDPMTFLPHMAYSYATGATFSEQHRRSYQRKTHLQVKVLTTLHLLVPLSSLLVGFGVWFALIGSGSVELSLVLLDLLWFG